MRRETILAKNQSTAARVTGEPHYLQLLVIIISVMIAAVIMLFHTVQHRQINPVPAKIKNQVSFPVDYPEANKLPGGFSLVASLFAAKNDIVLFTIDGAHDNNVSVTERVKPSAAILGAYTKQYLSLHNQFKTSLGTLSIGETGGQELASLPIDDQNTWILAAAQPDFNQQTLIQIMRAFVAP